MGTCSSCQFSTKDGNISWKTTVSIVHLDGKLQQFKEPIKARHVLSKNRNCFLCSSESMHVGSILPHVEPNEELHLDQIYFLLPLSKSHIPLSLKFLCSLAIKANAALVHLEATRSMMKSSSVSQTNYLTHASLLNLSGGRFL